MKKKYLFLAYSFLFVILCMIVFYPFYISGKSFVWGIGAQDGMAQHLNAVIYWGQYIREFFGNLLEGHMKLPMWDMSIGYGADVLTTLNYYAIGDPINLIYIFSNKYNAEYFYDFGLILRMYLVGISFICYGRYMKKDNNGILIGSLIYLFSGVLFQSAMRHPFFLNPMIYLPILFIGIEKIFRKEKPYCFIFTVTISAVSNFYYFYMLTVFAVIYALIRFRHYERKENFIRIVGKFAGWYLLGVGISAIILLPVILGFLGNARSGASGNSGMYFCYSLSYYLRGLFQFIGFDKVERGTNLNFVPLSVLAVTTLFLQKKKKRIDYKIAFILAILFLSIPMCSYVLHGFSYPMNRWIFSVTFLLAITVTEMYTDLLSLSRIQAAGIIVITEGYVLAVILAARRENLLAAAGKGVKAAAVVLTGTLIMVLLVNYMKNIQKSAVRHWLILSVVCGSIGVAGIYHFSPKKSMVLKEYLQRGQAYNVLCGKEVGLLDQHSTKELYRTEAKSTRNYNWGIIDCIPNTTNYFSITDKNVSQAVRDLESTDYRYLFRFRKLDEREGLLSLFSVKYQIRKKSDPPADSGSYQKIKEMNGCVLYENKNALPFGYTYDSCITESEYEKLNPLEKEEALLKYAVVEEKGSSLPVVTPEISVETKTLRKHTSRFVSEKGKAQWEKINIPLNPEKESYIRIEGIGVTAQNHENKKWKLSSPENKIRMRIWANGRKYSVILQEKGSSYYFGKRNYIIKLERRHGEKEGNINIRFHVPGTYSIDRISLIEVNKKELKTTVKERKDQPVLKNIKYDKGNHFSGDITVKDKKILCIPIPYSKGWKAFDCGKPVKIKRIQRMFMGIELSSGKHHIQLDYITPGLRLGAIISVASSGLLLVLMLRKKKFEK